jgi:ferredoxin
LEIDPSGAFYSQTKQAQLGKNDLDKIESIGESKKLPDYKIPPLGGEAIMNNEAIQEMIHSRTLLFPQVAPDLCTACETCIEQCPVLALSMNGDIPQVDADTCITCFCCQEICPEKAITLK